MLQIIIKSCDQSVSYSAVVVFFFPYSPEIYVKNYFSPDFIETHDKAVRNIDISRFYPTNGLASGTYLVEIYINVAFTEEHRVDFVDDNGALKHILNSGDFIQWSVKSNAEKSWMQINSEENMNALSIKTPACRVIAASVFVNNQTANSITPRDASGNLSFTMSYQ